MAERAARAGDNFASPEKVTEFVDRIENMHDEMESAKGEYMAECKARREDIKSIYDEAKDEGIPKKALKAVITARQLERKAKAARDDLADLDLQDKFDLIRLKLGDLSETPLGEAAIHREAAA
jgi:uncharacterized protein (UPF0335 family)